MGHFAIKGSQTTVGGQTKSIGPVTIVGLHEQQGTTTEVTLVSGDNLIPIPASATAVLIRPATGNTQALTVQTDAIAIAGSGQQISKTNPSLLAIRAGVTPLRVNAGGNTPGPSQFTFI